jgi:hypothetical protein
MDNKILTTIIDKFKGGPVGLTTLATAVSRKRDYRGSIRTDSGRIYHEDTSLVGKSPTKHYKHLGGLKHIGLFPEITL